MGDSERTRPQSFPESVRGENRPSVYQSFSNHVHSQIQSIQRPHPEQHEIILLGEYHVISRRSAARAHDRVTNIALKTPPIRHNESLTPFRTNAEGFQHGSRNLGKRALRVDKGIGELLDLTALRYTLDPDSRSEDSHVRHSTPRGPVSPYHCSAAAIFAMPGMIFHRFDH